MIPKTRRRPEGRLAEGVRLDAALADAERAARASPLDPITLSYRAREDLEFLEFMARLGLMIADRPGDVDLHRRMGDQAAESGRPVLAAQSSRAALELDPNCRGALDGLAALRREAGP
ncbi:hypothetical protein [Tautonia plasticadhaerens]|uniref:Tetratricopeptide repeat protein n=1 Tax=Tautonia plasticadhaerens TaxID=2527974 RepID=A0A518H0B3_9BACT|nr:hypothetical protein [Tautonia plasticadhaerens]QDV34284.1 hypothetical protein ElP_21690 [Tautonia plasticadhaerens]